MNRIAALNFVLAISLTAATAMAQTAAQPKPQTAKPTVKAAARPAPKPATSREEAKDEAKGLALATEATEAINATQLDIAARVLTGKASCEYNQTVDVDPVDGKPGMFKVRYKGVSYVMVPEETSTGAVRLFDRKTAVVWLQIPVKSMLLDSREGHRMVDLCTHSEQRAAVDAVKGAAANAAARAGTLTEPAAARK